MGSKWCLRRCSSATAQFLFGVLVCSALCSALTIIRSSDDKSPIITEPPSAPRLLNVECKEESAIVQWEPTGNNTASILEYSIHYNTGFANDMLENAVYNIPASKRSHEVPIESSGSYTFRVVAYNEIGLSLPSVATQSVICTEEAHIPHWNPFNVEGHGTTSNNMVITWTKMHVWEHQGPGFLYRVFWKPANSKMEWQVKEVTDWQQERLVINDLPAFTPYDIKVEAYNDLGRSRHPAESVIGYSGDDRPLLGPTNVVSHSRTVNYRGNVSISWDPVPLDSIRGHFQGYKIRVVSLISEKTSRSAVHTVGPNVNSLHVPLNESSIRSRVCVMAYNKLHDGPPGDCITFIHSKGVGYPAYAFIVNSKTFRVFNGKGPEKNPKNLVMSKLINNKTAIVAWDPINDASVYGVFDGYKIQTWSKNDEWENRLEIVVPLNVTSVELNNLVPSVENYVRVLVVDSRFNGPPSKILTITPEGIPGPFPLFNVVAMGSSTLKLNWTQPKEINGKFAGYHISYEHQRHPGISSESNLPKGEQKLVISDLKVTTVKLVGLEPSARYKIVMRASTAAGLGGPATVEAVTKPVQTPDKPVFSMYTLEATPEGRETGVRVNWNPNLSGHPGNHFYVEYRKKGETEWQRTKNETKRDFIEIEDIRRGTFEVRVVAVDGPHSVSSDIQEIFSFIAVQPAPQPPPRFLRPGVELNVGWNSRGSAGSFSVSYKDQKNDDDWTTIENVPYTKSHKISELREDTVYEIKVVAVDQ